MLSQKGFYTILRQKIAIHFRSVLPKRNWTPTVKNSHQYYSYSLIHNTYHYGYDLTIVLLRAQHLMMMICLKISTYKIRRNNDARLMSEKNPDKYKKEAFFPNSVFYYYVQLHTYNS